MCHNNQCYHQFSPWTARPSTHSIPTTAQSSWNRPPTSPPKFRGKRGGRSFKRRREDSGQGDEGAKKEKKEGEGESTGEAMEVTSGAGAEAKTES